MAKNIVTLGNVSNPVGMPWAVPRPIKPTFKHIPITIVDTDGLENDKWLEYRHLGVGGSNGAGVKGHSPFCTNIDVFDDKTRGITKEFDEEGEFRLECGHAMEPLVAKACALKHPDWRIFKDTNMYRHPEAPFLLADMDYMAELPDGQLAVIECKFVNPETRYEWNKESKLYYEIQCRHYMAVRNVDVAVLCVLWGNNPTTDYVEYTFKRDKEWEIDYINSVAEFWYDHVVPGVAPKLISHYGAAVMATLSRLLDSEEAKGTVELDDEELVDDAMNLRDCEERIAALQARVKALSAEAEQYKARLVLGMDGAENGVLHTPDGTTVYISNKRECKNKIDTALLKDKYPAVYAELLEGAAAKITLSSLKKASSAAHRECVKSVPSDKRTFTVKFRDSSVA